ncbi:MAG TPA: hypothetical protein VLJ37_11615 [bacterium]|nr:hypothetical protein [bacterium]
MPEYNFYVLGFFDLMGQSQLLDCLSDQFVLDCLNSGKRAELIEKVKPTFGRVKRFRDNIRRIVSQINQEIPLPSELVGKVSEKAWKQLTTAQVNVEFMGDAALLKVRISSNAEAPLSVVSIKDLMESISMEMLSNLRDGIPVRGAIELGWGTHIEDHSIYGTMLHRAARLEKEAGHLRIVIGESLISYLSDLAAIPQKGVAVEEAKIITDQAKTILSLVEKDDDDKWILNYLRKETYSVPENEAIYKECKESAKTFINSEIELRKNSGEEKLLNIYQAVKRFFQKHGAW